MHPLRILIDDPQAGAVNMAIDEAILQAVSAATSGATLRFYRWSEPTISLGYFQKYADFETQHEHIKKLPVVRRQTGGGAILHDDELTYSLILPLNSQFASIDIEGMYQLVHNSYRSALAKLGMQVDYRGGSESGNSQRGPFFCFSRLHRLDLMLDNQKLLGSAQRRIKNAVLQHGSLILDRHFPQQPSAAVQEKLNEPLSLTDLISQLSSQISSALDMKAIRGRLSEEEKEQATTLQTKYAGQLWTRQR